MRYNQDDIMKYRLEALKMAYNFIMVPKNISPQADCGTIPEPGACYPISAINIKDILHDIFSLSEINLEYILNGSVPEEDEDSSGE